MPASASPDPDYFRTLLEARRHELTAEVDEGQRRRSSEERYELIAGEVGDPGDASVAIEQVDLRNAQIERDMNELRAVERALARIADGSYGFCIQCGQDIPPERLEANPTAERDIRCQAAFEAQYARGTLMGGGPGSA